MSKVNSFLASRLKQASHKLSKMTGLAELSSSGSLSSFSGVFRVGKLNQKEEEDLLEILKNFQKNEQKPEDDLVSLLAITSEVKAINNQAAILHGERIKRAQDILKNYKDGAFSAWLILTYGNRQTPYNFLQYYELYSSLPILLQNKLEEMPRQAVYTLASRQGSLEAKSEIINSYQGEPKAAILCLIRERFPLDELDKRKSNPTDLWLNQFQKLKEQMQRKCLQMTSKEKAKLKEKIKELLDIL
ncbi:MAG: CT583 family protein [Rhabdochlamydiaceae bacterium]